MPDRDSRTREPDLGRGSGRPTAPGHRGISHRDPSQFGQQWGGIYVRAIKAVAAHSLGVGIALLARIVYPPLFLRAWGVELYGEWLILSSAVLYLLLSEFGTLMYIGNRLVEAYATNDQADFRTLLHTGMVLFLLVPLGVLVLFMAAIICFPVWSAFSIVKTPAAVAYLVLLVLGLQVCISLPRGILMGVYRAVGMLPRSAMLNNLNQLLQLVLVSMGLWLGFGMTWIAVMHVLPTLVVVAISLRELHRLHPEIEVLSLRAADWRTARDIVKPSAHFFSIQMSQTITVQSVLLIVGAVLSSIQVVLFSALRTVTHSMRQVLAIFVNSVHVEITRYYARGEPDKLLLLFRVALRATLAAAVVFAGIFHHFGEQIFLLWLGSEVGYQQLLMDLFLVYGFQLVCWTLCSNVLMSINRHHKMSLLLLASSALTMIFVYAGGKMFGLAGVIAGLIVADLVLPFWMAPALMVKYIPGFSWRAGAADLLCASVALVLIGATPWAIPVVFIGLAVWVLRALPAHSIVQRIRFWG